MQNVSVASQISVSAYEADKIVDGLKLFNISEVGSPEWLDQQDKMDKLNLQAHQSAQSHTDEYVVESIVSSAKVSLLLLELLVIEVWKEKVLPHLEEHLAHRVDNLTSNQLLYSEAGMANLLEVCLYHEHACQAMSEDALLELCDWYLTDHVNTVALGVAVRLISTNDTISALIPLIDRPPWKRRVKKESQTYQNGQWQVISPEGSLKLTQHEAQVWLALNNLLVDPGCREKALQQSSHGVESLQRLRRHMNEVLLDQLPVLADLQRVLDELAMGCSGLPHNAHSSLIIEQVPMIRTSIMKGQNWRKIAEEQRESFFGAEAAALSEQRMRSMLKTLEAMCDMQPDPAADKA
ncbi:hypothetical protein COCSUDRAFT_55461 [Coccomyxa subellipsoidea C-169]|uniref:Uncharacterized protein n=1 Tax=Coccomyxa subellipsoidea (strain C-169) TaxID=574566 RepID=I0Z9Y6_COCSC|nr:hypothetical protein COCSUDRAFT_55461 [Coccomyxa subellipsoidea C-169]EIE27455.1 hypothetical protein COCSUDRAFT_55461 [Coccomyxa subellipsoidea C-169]|eukprot:XP_005651999.1 hypothetical protein COCSUDRAFT_55461 [Coccomyxa subellipsoidea C-169]